MVLLDRCSTDTEFLPPAEGFPASPSYVSEGLPASHSAVSIRALSPGAQSTQPLRSAPSGAAAVDPRPAPPEVPRRHQVALYCTAREPIRERGSPNLNSIFLVTPIRYGRWEMDSWMASAAWRQGVLGAAVLSVCVAYGVFAYVQFVVPSPPDPGGPEGTPFTPNLNPQP